ncbi:hypothetical protein JW877_00325 [bacterium]|nr:hypothetical protein [bacterium]
MKIILKLLPVFYFLLFTACSYYSRTQSADAQSIFENANHLLKRQRFDEAFEEFKTLVEVYPQSVYADDAFFKLGYICCVKKNYSLANVHFNIVLNEYPASNWAFDAALWADVTKAILNCDDLHTELLQKIGQSSGKKEDDLKLVEMMDQLRLENRDLRNRIEELERLIGELE